MIKKVCFLLAGIIIIFSCSKHIDEVVVWKPNQPRSGDKITVIFNPRRLIGSDQSIFMVYQLLQNQTVKTFRIQLKNKKNSWKTMINTEKNTYLLRLKFEDQMDRVEDNSGWGWNIMIRDNNGSIKRNTHHKLGVIFSQKKRSDFVPDYSAAIKEFNQELKLFPDNYQVWFDLWETKLKASNWSKHQLDRITFQLDSLMSHSLDKAESLALAFNTSLKLLNDYETALKYGETLLTKYQNRPEKDGVEYSMIFLKHKGNQDAIHNELNKFSKQRKHSGHLKSVYYQLALFFQQVHNLEESINYFRKYAELEPDAFPIWLNLANLYMRKQDYKKAGQMIEQAYTINSAEHYFQAHPWEEPLQRQVQLNLNQCQILSTQAALETALQNYQQALKNRKLVIELDTPFPAFEWVKIGDLYFQLGKLDSAEYAYIKAISINPTQEDAINKFKEIHQLIKGDIDNFNNYLQNEIDKELKVSAKLAPDFELTDLDGNTLRFSDQQGKLVILTFWDSWSKACQQEVPQLNALVGEFNKNPAVIFWAISVEAPVSIKKFIKQNPFNFHHFHSGYHVKRLFNVIGFPTHIVIDKFGKIRYNHIGYSENIGQKLSKEILLLLKEADVTS